MLRLRYGKSSLVIPHRTSNTNSCVFPGFEGPEKRLEVDFTRNLKKPEGLRAINREKWQEMLNLAKCTILNHKSNQYFDAYLLSESSLFVYPDKVMLKTCGTTTLLRAIPKLIEYGLLFDMEVKHVMYSRKNFLFPHQQDFPHESWTSEMKCLNEHFRGTGYVLGPLSAEHWYLYVADYTDEPHPELTLEIMMHDLDRNVAKQFYKNPGGIMETPDMSMIPGNDMDEFHFEPCGYSMNGLLDKAYTTIHVTPEPHCSYASFETNLTLPCYNKLISHVLSVFKPQKATITLFAENREQLCTIHAGHQAIDLPGFVLRHRTFSELGNNSDIALWHYDSVSLPPRSASPVNK
jgi:S-adenosylmethionine decarboxylase